MALFPISQCLVLSDTFFTTFSSSNIHISNSICKIFTTSNFMCAFSNYISFAKKLSVVEMAFLSKALRHCMKASFTWKWCETKPTQSIITSSVMAATMSMPKQLMLLLRITRGDLLCKTVQTCAEAANLGGKIWRRKKFSRTTSSTTVEWVKRGVKHFIAGS